MTGASNDNAPPLDGLMAAAEAARKAVGRGPPPVHLWNPPDCGDIDIRIARDGTWFHEKTPIGREALVRLFASILRLDPDGYWLVTPVEKMRIRVDDVPFIATRVDGRGEALVFQTNVGDEVIADAGHDLRVAWNTETGEPAPYLHVRRGLLARLSRPVFYELVDLAKVRDTPQGPTWGVSSNGAWFPIAPPGAGL